MEAETGFVHSVYFYLHEGSRPEQAQQLAEGCRRHLTGIPGVLRIEVGFPAGTPRPVVDNSYGVALIVAFADRANHDLYQEHPDHLRFVEECGPLWSRVQVYDVVL